MDGDSAQATKRPHVEGGLPSNLAEDAMQRSLNDMVETVSWFLISSLLPF